MHMIVCNGDNQNNFFPYRLGMGPERISWVNSGCCSKTAGGKIYENHDYRQ